MVTTDRTTGHLTADRFINARGFHIEDLDKKELSALATMVINRSKCPTELRDEAVGAAYEALLKAENYWDPVTRVSPTPTQKRAFVIWKASLLVLDWYREWDRYRTRHKYGVVNTRHTSLDEIHPNARCIAVTDTVATKHVEDVDLTMCIVEDMAEILTDREMVVFNEVLVKERMLANVGEELGITESRVCQIAAGIRKKAVDKLSHYLLV